MIPSQMLKAEGCILGILSQKETYGYEISSQLAPTASGPFQRAPSTPCCCGWRKTAWCPPPSAPRSWGPSGNTTRGGGELQQFIQNYAELSHAVGNLLSALKGDAGP